MNSSPLAAGHLGETWKKCKTKELIFTEVTFRPKSRFSKHSHANACFTLIRQGFYVESFGKRLIQAGPNSVIYRPPEAQHSNEFGLLPISCSLVEISSSWLEQLSRETLLIDEPSGFENGEIVWLAARLCQEFSEADDVSELVIEGLMLEMLAKATRITRKAFARKPPNWLRRVNEILDDQFTEKLSLEQIAQLVSVHPSYLPTAYRQFFQTSIGDHVRRRRVEFASRELSGTDKPIVEIALAAGYAHQSHFANSFKRFTGLSPAKYRAIYRKS